MSRIFVPGTVSSDEPTALARWFAFSGNKLLVQINGKDRQIPRLASLADIGLEPVRIQFLGTLDNQPCYSAELSGGAAIPADMELRGLRELYGTLETPPKISIARKLIDWFVAQP